jgi:hypothetical protein
MAKVTEDYFDGSARKAETVLGWNRRSVQLGLDERRTGMICVDNYQARGRYNSVEVLPNARNGYPVTGGCSSPGRSEIAIAIFVCPHQCQSGTRDIDE